MSTRGLCWCGCGQPTRLATATSAKEQTVKGEPRRYVAGHQPRASKREKHPAWAGGRRTTALGYVQLRMPEHPRAKRGYVFEHIVVVERALGKSLDPKHPIHHADANGQNNANTNLVVCEDTAYHGLLHRRLRAFLACGNPAAHRCELCGGFQSQDEMNTIARPDGTPRSYHRSCAQIKNQRDRAKREARKNQERSVA